MLVSSVDPVFGSKSRYKVRLEEGADFILYKKELSRFGIEAGEEIAPDVYREILTDVFIPRARMRAMHLLVRQDRTTEGLRRKLRQSGYPSEAVEDAIEYVSGYGYIDDVRFIQGYIRSHRSSKSRRHIIDKLQEKGISSQLIRDTIDMMESEEEVFDDMNIIRQYLDRRTLEDDKSRKKAYDHLLRAGFSSSDIRLAFKDFL